MARPLLPKGTFPEPNPAAERPLATGINGEQDASREPGQKPVSFMFIPATGLPNLSPSHETHRSIRRHVMHNYVAKDATRHSIQSQHGYTEPSVQGGASQNPTIASNGTELAGQQFRFKLRSGELEPSPPVRAGKKRRGDLSKAPHSSLRSRPTFISSMPPKEHAESASDSGGRSAINSEVVEPAECARHGSRSNRYSDSQAFPETESGASKHRSPVLSPATILIGHSPAEPFNVLSFPLNYIDANLIDRFQQHHRKPWCPINAQGSWLPFALHDVLLFHATMYNLGMFFHDSSLDFFDRHPQVIEHKLVAIRLLNHRMANPVEATKDETIAAVATLTNMEIGYGRTDEAEKHIAGLETLVAMRGGLDTLNSRPQRHIQRLISWNDLMFAELAGRDVRFTKLDILDEAGVEFRRYASFRNSMRSAWPKAGSIWNPLLDECSVLFEEITQLTQEIEAKPFEVLSEEEKMTRGDLLQWIERRLQTATRRTDGDGNEVRKWRLTAVAGLCYVHHFLRGNPLRYRMFDGLSRQLRQALLAVGYGGVEDVSALLGPELLVWILSIGSIISTRRQEHIWFVRALASACEKFGCSTWEALRACLSGFVWAGLSHEHRYWPIWEEVERLL